MKINQQPEKLLGQILRSGQQQIIEQNHKFKTAKKLLKYLKKDIQGLPKLGEKGDESPNLYNFVLRRHTESSVVQYQSRLKQLLKKSDLNHSFTFKEKSQNRQEVPTQKKSVRFGSGLQRRSIRKTQKVVAPPQVEIIPLRRKSCECPECGTDNAKIQRLKVKGSNNSQKMQYGKFLKMRQTFFQDCTLFSEKLSHIQFNLLHGHQSRRHSTLRIITENQPLRRRCHSQNFNQESPISIYLHRDFNKKPSPTKHRQSMNFLRRQQTINDKLMLIPLRMQIPMEEKQIANQNIKINEKQNQKTIGNSSMHKVATEFRKNTLKLLNSNMNSINQFSPSMTQYSNKSINKQLQLQVKHSIDLLKKPLLKEMDYKSRHPYRSVKVDFLLKIKKRQQ